MLRENAVRAQLIFLELIMSLGEVKKSRISVGFRDMKKGTCWGCYNRLLHVHKIVEAGDTHSVLPYALWIPSI